MCVCMGGGGGAIGGKVVKLCLKQISSYVYRARTITL